MSRRIFTIEHLELDLPPAARIHGDPTGKTFSRVTTTADAAQDSLTWIAPHRKDKAELAQLTRASFVLCDPSVELDGVNLALKCFIVVPSPKSVLSRVIARLFVQRPTPGIDPSAVISDAAVLGKDVHIGPLTYVGAATIGAGTVILGHCFIHDNVTIGRNVLVHAGCVIGGEGFGFERLPSGELEKFPHIGSVVIGDEVELQTMTHVDRGTLGDTVIGRGTKIDSCCHIAHNVVIGEYNLIAAHTMFSGSVTIGDRCWVGPSTSFRDVLSVGDEAFIGIGSLIVKDLGDGVEVMGAPARATEEYKRVLAVLRQLSAEAR